MPTFLESFHVTTYLAPHLQSKLVMVLCKTGRMIMFLSYNVITTIIITIIAIIITFFITESMDAAKWSHNTNCYASTTFTRDGYEG